MLEDDGLFEAFIDVERKLMLAVGLAPSIVDPTITKIRELRRTLVDTYPSSDEVRAGVLQLRAFLQALRAELGEALEGLQDAANHQSVLRKLVAALEGLLGFAIAGVNGAGALLSLGIGVAPAAVSGAAGAAIAADAQRRWTDDG